MLKSAKLVGLAAAAVIALSVLPALSQAQKKSGLGRVALPQEVKAWDHDIRPDGAGLPAGKGSVKEGETIFLEQCAACHGEFGEGAARWPVLAGGHGSLKSEGPEKTIGSFWPYAATVYDYIYRAMPFGNAQSLTPDQTYALTAYLLHLNDIVKDDFVLTRENFASVKLPNANTFFDDDREKSERHFWVKKPCMTNCKPAVTVTGRARMVDVTPDSKEGPKVD